MERTGWGREEEKDLFGLALGWTGTKAGLHADWPVALGGGQVAGSSPSPLSLSLQFLSPAALLSPTYYLPTSLLSSSLFLFLF